MHMKILLGIATCFLLAYTTKAQNVVATQDDFKYLSLHNLNVNTSTITAFSSNNVKGSQYLFDQWTPGSVTTLDNTTFSNNYTFNFDKLNQNLYANSANQGNLCVLLDKTQIRHFTLGNQTYYNGKLLDPTGKDVFYQVLVLDTTKFSLYKLNITKFMKADYTDVSKVRSGNVSNEYVDNFTYYISATKGELKKVNLTEHNIRKVLKDQEKKLDAFFNMNPNNEVDESLLVLLVSFLNQ